MPCVRFIVRLSVVVASVMPLTGCEKKSEPAPSRPAAGTTSPAKADDHAHNDGDGHHHGVTIQLGEQIAGGFNVKASRDGAVTPGKDAAIDVWVTGGTSKVTAVRFWIGTQDGKGSVKAKAELEKDNWHTHAEVPNPLPQGSKLWVEVEDDKGAKSVVGFELKS